MSDGTPHLDRRGFFGTTAAIGLGIGLGAAFSAARRTEARFSATSGFPERPVTVDVTLDDPEVDGAGKAWLHILTPTEHLVRELPTVEFRRGQASLDTTLVYPYETRVPGQYVYHVEIAVGAHRVVTAEPAAYGVRKIHWFS